MATKKKTTSQSTTTWPKISQGTHLTVKTFEDGSTELVWDDEQLLRDVQSAILKAESVLPVNVAKKTKSKKASQ